MRFAPVTLACIFLSVIVSSANASLILTPTISLTSQTVNTATYAVRATITSNGGAAATNTISSYGFTVSLTSGAAFTLVNPGINPTQLIGNGPGFESEFTHLAVTTPVVGNSVGFIGQNSNATTRDLTTNDATRFREFSFTINKLGSSFTLNVGVQALAFPAAGLVGGTGFVDSAGTTLAANFTAAASTSITAVPEPSSVAMFSIAGVLGLGIRMRKWRSKRKFAA